MAMLSVVNNQASQKQYLWCSGPHTPETKETARAQTNLSLGDAGFFCYESFAYEKHDCFLNVLWPLCFLCVSVPKLNPRSICFSK